MKLPRFRHAVGGDLKSSLKQLLFDETLQKIHGVEIMDHYFFDFEPPDVYLDEVESDTRMSSGLVLVTKE